MAASTTFAQHEIRRTFRQPITWLALAIFSAVNAIYFMLLLVRYLENQAQLGAAGVSVEIVTRYFGGCSMMLILVIPIVTMATISGDRQSGLLRFYFSTPLSSAGYVLGKTAGVAAVLFAVIILLSLLPLTLLWGAPIDTGILATNCLGVMLFSAFHIALGIFATAINSSALGAALISLSLSLSLWFAEGAERLGDEHSAIGLLSTLTRMRGFYQGLLVSYDVLFFVTGTVVLLGLAVAAINFERQL